MIAVFIIKKWIFHKPGFQAIFLRPPFCPGALIAKYSCNAIYVTIDVFDFWNIQFTRNENINTDKQQDWKSKKKIKEDKIKLSMTFEEAMKKALNTPLPKKKKKNQNQRCSAFANQRGGR